MTFMYRVCAYAGLEFLWHLDFVNEMASRDFYSACLKAEGNYRYTWEQLLVSSGKD